MYCLVSTPTGPRPLSVARIVIFLLFFISLGRHCCWRVRFDRVRVGLKVLCICWVNVQMWVSMSREGRGGRQDFFYSSRSLVAQW
jgi:hypothetical protein